MDMEITAKDYFEKAVDYLQKIWPEYTRNIVQHMVEEDLGNRTVTECQRVALKYAAAAFPGKTKAEYEEMVTDSIKQDKRTALLEELEEQKQHSLSSSEDGLTL